MATFGFRGAYVAKYDESSGSPAYSGFQELGNTIECDIQFKSAAGRLNAKDALSKYRKKITGGSVTTRLEDILLEARKLILGESESVRQLTGGSSKSVTGLKTTDTTLAPYVGFAAFAPDDVDGKDKFTAIFTAKTLFGLSGYKFKTMEDNIEFQTPSIVGEFMKAKNGDIFETATLDSEEDAIAWCKLCLGGGK